MAVSSLSRRISAIFILFGLALAAVLTIQGYLSQQMVVHPIWREILQSSTDQYLSGGQPIPGQHLPSQGVIRGWHLAAAGMPGDMPGYFGDLAPGYHDEHQTDDYDTERSYAVLVTQVENGRVIMAVDITDLENYQNMTALVSVLIALCSGITILAAILWTYRTMKRPVQSLAQQMEALDPEQPTQRLATDFTLRELHDIAFSVNRHLERVERFIERERSLLDQASHEFRTPIAVIAGAVDVIKLYELPAAVEGPLARIEATIGNLSEIMSALLFLSREPDQLNPVEHTRLDTLTAALMEDHEHLLQGAGAAFVIAEFDPVVLDCPEAMVRIVVSNLLRNAAEHSNEGPIRISLTAHRLSIQNGTEGFDAAETARRYTRAMLDTREQGGGQGLGLFITRRICERFGWNLKISSTAANETVAELHFA
ncbi:ATP-binding protein [Pseudomonas sp. R151218B TE3479]